MRIPEWMKKQFAKGECSHCHKKLTKNGIKGHGIFEELSPKKKKRYTHYYQYICPKCALETRFRFPTDWQEFIGSMVELAEKEWEETHPKQIVEGISDAEVESVKKLLETTDSYEDFLTKIGVQMSEYIEDEEDETQNEDK